MFLLGDTVVYSASDLSGAVRCEFATLRRLDERLGLVPRLEVDDPMRERSFRLGNEHEQRVLDSYRERFGAGVVEIPPPADFDVAGLVAQHELTMAALRDGADVVTQAGFFDGRFHGRADFLERVGEVGGRPRYAVVDAKLSSRATSAAVLQLAAYADQLIAADVPVADHMYLHLGTGEITAHETTEHVHILTEHRRRLQHLLDSHQREGVPLAWGDERYEACLWCDYCRPEIERSRDVKGVWGIRRSHRSALRAAGLTTIDALAASDGPVPKVRPDMLDRLRAQARLQLRQEAAEAAGVTPSVFSEVHSLDALDALPAPDPGDVFFDFEGDPLWTDGDHSTIGLEYLFGLVEAGPDERYVTFWAHDRAGEKAALEAFLAYLRERRATHPGLHVYHYASYEQSALTRLAARHGVGGDEVASLLEAGVFVDLYDTVKNGVRVSQRSYSIKKLEPLYMGTELRDDGGVTTGGASVVAYVEACAMRDAGDLTGWRDRLGELAAYNRYDCISTLRLRDWLLAQRDAARAGRPEPPRATITAPAAAVADATPGREPAAPDPRAELAAALRAHPQDPAAPLLAAALEYHRREIEPFWTAHYRRLDPSRTQWTDSRDVLDVQHARVLEGWSAPERGRRRRLLEVVGLYGTGTTVGAGSDVFCVYDRPLPEGMTAPDGHVRATSYAYVVSRETTDEGLDRIVVSEALSPDVSPHDGAPVLITPGAPPSTKVLAAAIELAARDLAVRELGLSPGPTPPADAPVARAALDVLRAAPPRQLGGGPPPQGPSDEPAEAVLHALRHSDDSYVAVQGPPGTGKTHLGSRVVARLVEQGWRVGVVAQSHAVVEHMLRCVVEAGVAPDRVAKRGRAGSTPGAAAPWVPLGAYEHAEFLALDGGRVVGGTAWDLANRQRFEVGSLDLLVIDEAGQFSLANTVAVATAARRLLLLGDPQQLPQVSQGRHDEPVDASALGRLVGDDGVLPPSRGVFLSLTWRMHPALCAAVSRLAYSGRLHSHPVTAQRHLEGLAPGVHVVDVAHRGNVTDSPEESVETVAQVRSLLGRQWTADGVTRPLTADDVVVVAAYNKQVQRIRADLVTAGLAAVRVGTVDTFQGQEAAVVIVSLAASSSADAPRGVGFLLSRQRLNVAISRGRWAAIIVRSPALTRHIPSEPEELRDLGAFIALCAGARGRRQRARRAAG